MYIGSSIKCKEYCQEQDKRKFDKYHSEHRHYVYDLHAFQEENRHFIRKSKKAWNNFAIKLQSFFKKIKTELEFIQNEAKSRLEFEQVKTAINSDDKELTKISMDILQEHYRNLTCQDIYDFTQLRKSRQHQSQPRIEEEEINFADQLIKQIRSCLRDICQDFRPTKSIKIHEDHRPQRKERDPRSDYGHKKRQTRKYEERQYNPTKKQKPRKYDVEDSEEESRRSVRGSTRGEPRRGRGGPYRGQEKRHEYRNRDEEPYVRRGDHQRQNNRQPIQRVPQSQDDRPRPLLKISQLTESNKAFDIELKLISCIKPLHNKQVWRVVDETGQIKLIIPYHRYLQEGSKIHLKNCYVKTFVRTMEIHTKFATRISCYNQKEEQLKVNNPIPPNRQYKVEEKGQPISTKERSLTKISDIEPEDQNLKIIAKVVKVTAIDEKQRKYRYILGDQTGIINAQFEKLDALLKEGNVVYLRGIISTINEKGYMYLTGGSKGKILIEPAHDNISSVNLNNNASGREYVEV